MDAGRANDTQRPSETPSASPGRRAFLLAALAGSVTVLTGCEPPASSSGSRRLPPAPDPDGGHVQLPERPPAVPPRLVVLERPLPPQAEPTIRVRVATLRPPTRRLRVEGDGPRVYIQDANGQPKAVATPATIEATLDGWLVIEAAGTPRAGTYEFASGALVMKPVPGSKGIRFQSDVTGSTSWPFEIRLTHRTDEAIGAIDIVGHVQMEAYLPGVLAKELYQNWSREAFLAQAVAARSYALCEMAQNATRHFDVVAGEASQAWVGATTHRTSLEAVQRTSGMVLTWDSRVVPAYYSSCCGGRPANAVDAIAPGPFNAIPPLTVSASSVRDCCRAAPTWRWRMSLPTGETAKRIAAWARTERPAMAKIDGVRSIDVAAVNAAGRPTSFRIVDAKNQTFEIPSERLRWAFNSDNPGLPVVRSRVRSGDFTAQVSAVSIALEGRGFGHGVGLCQYGAEGLAKDGATWREILRRFYPSADVVSTYGAKA
ncbi:MAG: SpoIID/LytB domain-containing protein [Phycisphaerae bacterium]|nr:SpoIID/LytB domain-containing protein [Phycisphaerae bacterium]